MKLNFHGANSVITVLSIGALAIFIFGFVISQNPTTKPITSNPPLPQKCGEYLFQGKETTACATCGNGTCEPYETCTASYVTEGGIVSMDCGVLYCWEDCENSPQIDPNIPLDLPQIPPSNK